MWSDIGSFFFNNWRDLISVTGFVITIWTLLATRSAAVAARDAARKATEEIQKSFARVDAVSTLASVVVTIERIYELQRQQSWNKVPELYKDVRQLLAKVKGSGSPLTNDDKDYIQHAVSEFARIEQRIETLLGQQAGLNDMPEMNQLITRHAEEFTRMEIELRRGRQ